MQISTVTAIVCQIEDKMKSAFHQLTFPSVLTVLYVCRRKILIYYNPQQLHYILVTVHLPPDTVVGKRLERGYFLLIEA